VRVRINNKIIAAMMYRIFQLETEFSKKKYRLPGKSIALS